LSVWRPMGDSSGAMTARPGAPAEIELKLLAPEGALAKLREMPFIVQQARNRGTVRRLETLYYDTPERLLFQQGASLRVRRSGEQFVQTLELAPAVGQPLPQRQWETPVDAITPDLAKFPVAEIGDPVATLNGGALAPVFVTKVRRHAQLLELPSASIQIAFDEGVIEAGERQEMLSEIELKLKAGQAGVLFDLGMQLLEAVPLRVGTRSKAARGHALAHGIVEPAAKAEPVAVTAELAVDDVIALLVQACWRHLLENLVPAEEGVDPEGVHQVRVALRRLRTICRLFARHVPSPFFHAINSEAKWLMQQIGPTRDWDVFAETTGAPHVASALALDLGSLQEAIARRCETNHAALRAVFADPRCSRFLLALGQGVEYRSWRNEVDSDALAALAQPIQLLADKILTRSHRKALKRGERFRRLDNDAQHNLRIDLKQLRYASEFFLPLYAGHASVKRYVARLSKLQSSLGRARDIVTGRSLLDAIMQEGQPELHLPIGAVAGWQARDRIAVAKTLRSRWRRFKSMPAFWGR
jgi:triphosphatase